MTKIRVLSVPRTPTRAYAAHKVLLRTCANGGVGAADEIMFDIAIPFLTQEARPVALHRPWTQSKPQGRDLPFLSKARRHVCGRARSSLSVVAV
jgi:hypothetical protein